MRRKEFTVDEEKEITAFLDQCSFGFLGTVSPDGQPRVTPLNFVYMDGCFYFHGSLAGEKMKQIKHDSSVSFTVAEEFSLIPPISVIPNWLVPQPPFSKVSWHPGRQSLFRIWTSRAGTAALHGEASAAGDMFPLMLPIPGIRVISKRLLSFGLYRITSVPNSNLVRIFPPSDSSILAGSWNSAMKEEMPKQPK